MLNIEGTNAWTEISICANFKNQLMNLSEKYSDLNTEKHSWSDEQHLKYVKLRDEYSSEYNSNGLLLQRLRVEFPFHSAKSFSVKYLNFRTILCIAKGHTHSGNKGILCKKVTENE
jgi:hypothetical protein